MKKNVIAVTYAALLLVLSIHVDAQQSPKVYRIGMLVSGSVATHGRRIDAFRQGLRELGYVEGKNIIIEYKYAEGKRERFAELAADMVRLSPDVIYVSSTGFTEAAKKATSTIPIVSTGGDLVGAGLVSSLARPGGNVTGSTNISPDVSGKRLELLKDAVPKIKRVAVLYHPNPSDEDEVKQAELAARAIGLTLLPVPARAYNEFGGAFDTMKRENADALMIIQGSLNNSHIKQLAQLALANRLPSISEAPDYAYNGCMMSYGANLDDLWRRGAIFVDKILKGRKPAELPVEQPTKFDFVINLKTAKQIGFTIPPNVLARADTVIK
jgi:putative tryptophan/tyrosine transport system substrate-binding protein